VFILAHRSKVYATIPNTPKDIKMKVAIMALLGFTCVVSGAFCLHPSLGLIVLGLILLAAAIANYEKKND
jgi:hypothetical protein